MSTIDFSKIPSKEILLNNDDILKWSGLLGRAVVSSVIDGVLEGFKSRAAESGIPDQPKVYASISAECRNLFRRRVIRVINGTGILFHTNMGRSPISTEVWDSCRSVNTGYSNLEFNLETGKRGKRNGLVPALLSHLIGCEGSMVVNNNAAAVYLILAALAKDREVIVSRGEQVQIGGGFRIPEILALSGARLVEVGTTNITTLDDYKNAFTEQTACILSVHRSNFAIRGFTSQPSLKDLKQVLPDDVFLFVDQGSGALTDGLKGETGAEKLLRDGADLVSFSCDKVLGAAQGGIIAGRADLVKKLERHQLFRVFRPGKTIYSLLEETLVRRVNGRSYVEDHIPADLEALEARASAVAGALPPGTAEVVPTEGSAGGGSSPDETFPSRGLRVSVSRPDDILQSLRDADVPVIGYIAGGSVFIDFICIDPADDDLLADTLAACLTGEGA